MCSSDLRTESLTEPVYAANGEEWCDDEHDEICEDCGETYDECVCDIWCQDCGEYGCVCESSKSTEEDDSPDSPDNEGEDQSSTTTSETKNFHNVRDVRGKFVKYSELVDRPTDYGSKPTGVKCWSVRGPGGKFISKDIVQDIREGLKSGKKRKTFVNKYTATVVDAVINS